MNKKYMLAIAALALAGILSLYLVNASDDSSADSYTADTGDHEVLEKMIEDAIAYMTTGELMDDLVICVTNDADGKDELDINVIYGGEYVKVFDLPRYMVISPSMIIAQVRTIAVEIYEYVIELAENLKSGLSELGATYQPIDIYWSPAAFGTYGALKELDILKTINDYSEAFGTYGESAFGVEDVWGKMKGYSEAFGTYGEAVVKELDIWDIIDNYPFASDAYGAVSTDVTKYIHNLSAAYGIAGASLDEPVEIIIQGDPDVDGGMLVKVVYQQGFLENSYLFPWSIKIGSDKDTLYNVLYSLFTLGEELVGYMYGQIYAATITVIVIA